MNREQFCLEAGLRIHVPMEPQTPGAPQIQEQWSITPLLHTLIPAHFSPLSLLPSVFFLLPHFEDDTIGTGSAESNVSCLLILEFEKERETFFF